MEYRHQLFMFTAMATARKRMRHSKRHVNHSEVKEEVVVVVDELVNKLQFESDPFDPVMQSLALVAQARQQMMRTKEY